MKRWLKLSLLSGAFVAVMAFSALAVSIMPQQAAAQGAVGSGGSGGGSCSGVSNCPHTNNGFGWYRFGVNADGPDAFKNGSTWAQARQACINSGNDTVIAFIIMTPVGTPGTSWVYDYQSWNFWNYYGYRGNSGGNWLSFGAAQAYYNSLPAGVKAGYTWGNNVGWFCYDFSPDWNVSGYSRVYKGSSPSYNNAGTGTISGNVGETIYWYHRLRNTGPGNMNQQISYRIDRTGYGNGWNTIKSPSGSSSGNANTNFVNINASTGTRTQYTIQPSDAGRTLCQRIWYNPRSSTSNTAAAAAYTCVQVNYSYALTPTITGVSDGGSTEPDTTVSLDGVVTNGGPTASQPDIEWQITKTVYNPGTAIVNRPGGVNPNDPCGFFTGSNDCDPVANGIEAPGYGYPDTESYPATVNIDNLQVGTRVCFAMSIKPNSSTSGDWRHSQLYCLTVNKKPKVQVWGGDLIVGRGSVNNAAPASSEVRTSISNPNGGGYYGSWSEYGIIASGLVTNMASGSAYVGGASSGSICGLSYLTIPYKDDFTNSCNTASVGGYQHTRLSPDIPSRFPTDSATPDVPLAGNTATLSSMNGLYTSSVGSFSVQGGGDIGAGQSVIIRAEGSTVFITGDINYTSGSLNSIASIPQVVIIARNIIIADNVQNVDAWLVATGTGADGIVNTCAIGGTDYTTQPSELTCGSPLTINGAVSANHLVMRRTFGAGVGADSGIPAEIFNLRADAYIWASGYAQGTGRLPTVDSKELPPRF